MPRKPRIEFPGAFYHVITRGNQKQKVFKEKTDFEKYCDLLSAYKDRYRFFLYAFTLMDNHVHLLVETQDTPLSKILQGINQSYTMYFNRKYETVGHLFQGRYKAILCDRDAYLLALLKYLHLNPVRAGIAGTAEAHQWSSHRAYADGANHNGLIDAEPVLQMFSENKVQARRRYVTFMNNDTTITPEKVYATIDQRLQGNEEFVLRVREKHPGEIKIERQKGKYTLTEISTAIEKRYSLTVDQLRSATKKKVTMHGRRIFSLAAKEIGYKGKEIARYLGKDPASVTGYLRGAELGSEVEKLLDLMEREINV